MYSCIVCVLTARLRVTGAGHQLTSDVTLQSDVTGYYLCFSRRARLVVKVTATRRHVTNLSYASGLRPSLKNNLRPYIFYWTLRNIGAVF